METVGVSKLRENLITFLKKVEAGESIKITSRGREVAKLVPLENKMREARKALKRLRKTAIVGDVISPVGADWEVMK